jgi:hypothetical protein
MTLDDDIERVLDQWFTEGPVQMPARFLDDTLGRIDRAPKRHFVGRWPRAVRTHPRRLVAGAAVVALVVAGIGSALVTRAPAIGTNPSPSPSPTQGAISNPTSLVGRWIPVGTRHEPYQNGSHTLDVVGPADMVIGDADVRWDGLREVVINSKLIVGLDTIDVRLVTLPPGWNCQIGDEGTYRFDLSADGQRQTLTPVSDACAVRQVVLAGEWLRTETGGLAPGRHVSGIVKPFGDAGGHISYTVPVGWTDILECADCLTLGSPEIASRIHLYTNVVPSRSTGRCDLGIGTRPTDIATWLGTLPSLAVSTPTAISIGGLAGVQLDVYAVGNPLTHTCWFSQELGGDLSLADPDNPDQQFIVYSNGATRLILLDRGDGSTLLIGLEIEDKAGWDVLRAEAMPVVDSFEFIR